MNRTSIAGVGGLAFGILTFVAILVGSPVGGTYKASDVADYLAKGHRTAVFISFVLVVLAGVGLVCLLGRLREAVAGDARGLGHVFWGLGLASAASWVAGFAVVVAPPISQAYGGTEAAIDPK